MSMGFLSHPVGAKCGVTAEVCGALGGWRDDLTICGDEVDFSWRAQLASYRLCYAQRRWPVSVSRQGDATARQFYNQGRSSPAVTRTIEGSGCRPTTESGRSGNGCGSSCTQLISYDPTSTGASSTCRLAEHRGLGVDELEMPKVSVGVPTMGNRPHFLRQAIRSILQQTVENIEVFVSDNGPTSETFALVDSFGDLRLTYVKLPTPGLHANLNHCLRLGSAPFVAICQDDDYWLPTNLEKLIHAIRSPRVGVSHGAFDLVDGEGRVLRRQAAWSGWREDTIESSRAFTRRAMATVNPINMSSALFRRSALDETPFRIDDDVLCDTGLWLRLAQQWDVAFVGKTLSAFRVHPGAVSVVEGINDEFRHTTMYEIDLAQRVKKNFLGEYQGGAAESRHLWSLARRWAQHELLNVVVRVTSPERSPTATLKALRAAVTIEPSLLRLPRSYRIMLASLAGSRGRNTVRRMLGLPPIPTSSS
jgi:glycosyltransferase involved in cell wall biosynthesis